MKFNQLILKLFFYIPKTKGLLLDSSTKEWNFYFFKNDFELTKTSYYDARPLIFIFTLIPIYRL